MAYVASRMKSVYRLFQASAETATLPYRPEQNDLRNARRYLTVLEVGRCKQDARIDSKLRLPRGGRRSEVMVTKSSREEPLTRAGLREYAAVRWERYLQRTRDERRQLLDGVAPIMGIHRKAAIRLRRAPRPRAMPVPRGLPGGHGGRRDPVGGERPHRRPSVAPLRARAARRSGPVRRADRGPDVEERLRRASARHSPACCSLERGPDRPRRLPIRGMTIRWKSARSSSRTCLGALRSRTPPPAAVRPEARTRNPEVAHARSRFNRWRSTCDGATEVSSA
jgi:hypothetical protein